MLEQQISPVLPLGADDSDMFELEWYDIILVQVNPNVEHDRSLT